MIKWKCEICNSSFDNFDARGFDNKIYCPLCYYKKLYKDTELERERLNNIIDRTTKYVQSLSSKGRGCDIYEDIKQEILKELKDSDKE